MKKKIIVVAGPTASGKTGLGIEIAKAVNGEIISADSMQVYKNMPIATACPTAEEKAQAVHHMVEFLDNDKEFSVAMWCDLARKKIDEITERGKIPVIVGGTGLFIDSLVDNIIFEDSETDYKLREELMQKDADELYEELVRLDPESARDIHKNNKKRVVRALELYYAGTSKTQQNLNSRRMQTPYDVLYFVLSYQDRQVLYSRINKRVDLMVEQGLVQEARKNLQKSTGTSAQAIGHKELVPYFNGACSLDDALEHLKQKTRNYAKRQITWFKRRRDTVVLNPDVMGFDKMIETAIDYCEDFINENIRKGKSE